MEPRKPAQSPLSSSTPGRAYASSVKTARSPAVAAVRPAPPGASSGGGVVLPKITPPSNPATRTSSPGGPGKRMGWTTPRNPVEPTPASSPSHSTSSSPPSRTTPALPGVGLVNSSSNGTIGYWDNGAPTAGGESEATRTDGWDDETTQLSYMDQMYSKIQMLNAELDRERDESRARSLNVEFQVEQRERATLAATQRYGTQHVDESDNFGVIGAHAPLTSSLETNAAIMNQKFRPHQPRSTSPPQPTAVLGKDQLELCAALGKNAELRIRSREIERQADHASTELEQTRRQMKMAERRIANREEKLRALLKEKLHWQNEMKDLREQVVEEKMRQVDLMRRLETTKRETSAQLDAMGETVRNFDEDNHALRSYLVETKNQLAAQTKRLDDFVKQARDEKEKLTECIVEARGKFREWKESEAVVLRAQKDQALNHMKAEYELKIARHQEEKQKLREKVKDLEVSVRLMQKDRTLSPLELSLRKATILGSKDHAGTTEAELIEANVRIKELESLLEHAHEFQKRQEGIVKVSEATISRLIQEREVAALDVLANQRLPGSYAWSEAPANSDITPLSPLFMSTVPTGPPSAMSLSPRQLVPSARAQYKGPGGGIAYNDASSPRVDPSPPPPRQRVDHPVRPAAPPPRVGSVMSPLRKSSSGKVVTKAADGKPRNAELASEPLFAHEPTLREKELVQQIEEMQTALYQALAAKTERTVAVDDTLLHTARADDVTMENSMLAEMAIIESFEVETAKEDDVCLTLSDPVRVEETTHSSDPVADTSSEICVPHSVPEEVSTGTANSSLDGYIGDHKTTNLDAPHSKIESEPLVDPGNSNEAVDDDSRASKVEVRDSEEVTHSKKSGEHDFDLVVSQTARCRGRDPVSDSNDYQVSDLECLPRETVPLYAVTSLPNTAGSETSLSSDVAEPEVLDTHSWDSSQTDEKPRTIGDTLTREDAAQEEDSNQRCKDFESEGLSLVRKIAECVVVEAERSALLKLSISFAPVARASEIKQAEESVATILATDLVMSAIHASIQAACYRADSARCDPLVSSCGADSVPVHDSEVQANRVNLIEIASNSNESTSLVVQTADDKSTTSTAVITDVHTETEILRSRAFEEQESPMIELEPAVENDVTEQSRVFARETSHQNSESDSRAPLNRLLHVKATSLVFASSAIAVGAIAAASSLRLVKNVAEGVIVDESTVAFLPTVIAMSIVSESVAPVSEPDATTVEDSASSRMVETAADDAGGTVIEAVVVLIADEAASALESAAPVLEPDSTAVVVVNEIEAVVVTSADEAFPALESAAPASEPDSTAAVVITEIEAVVVTSADEAFPALESAAPASEPDSPAAVVVTEIEAVVVTSADEAFSALESAAPVSEPTSTAAVIVDVIEAVVVSSADEEFPVLEEVAPVSEVDATTMEDGASMVETAADDAGGTAIEAVVVSSADEVASALEEVAPVSEPTSTAAVVINEIEAVVASSADEVASALASAAPESEPTSTFAVTVDVVEVIGVSRADDESSMLETAAPVSEPDPTAAVVVDVVEAVMVSSVDEEAFALESVAPIPEPDATTMEDGASMVEMEDGASMVESVAPIPEPDATTLEDGASTAADGADSAMIEAAVVSSLDEVSDAGVTHASAAPRITSVPTKAKSESWNELVGGGSAYESTRLSSERSSVPVVKSPVMVFPDQSRYASAIVREMIRDPTLLAYDVKHEQSQPFSLLDERILIIDQHARHMQHDEHDKARVSVISEVPHSRHTAAIEGVLVTKRKKMDDESRRKSIALRIIPAFNYEPVLIKFQWSDFVVATPIRLMSSGSQLSLLHSLGGTTSAAIGERATAGAAIAGAAAKKPPMPTPLVQKMRLIEKKGVKLACGTYVIISVFIRPLEDGNENLRIQIYDSERVEEFQYDFHEDHLRDYVEEWKGTAAEARAFFERLEFRTEQGSIIIKMPDKIRSSTPALSDPDSDDEESEPRVYTPTPMAQLLTNLATTQPLELPPEPHYRLSPNAPASPQRQAPPLEHQFSAPNRLESRVFIPRIEEDTESMTSSVRKR